MKFERRTRDVFLLAHGDEIAEVAEFHVRLSILKGLLRQESWNLQVNCGAVQYSVLTSPASDREVKERIDHLIWGV